MMNYIFVSFLDLVMFHVQHPGSMLIELAISVLTFPASAPLQERPIFSTFRCTLAFLGVVLLTGGGIIIICTSLSLVCEE